MLLLLNLKKISHKYINNSTTIKNLKYKLLLYQHLKYCQNNKLTIGKYKLTTIFVRLEKGNCKYIFYNINMLIIEFNAICKSNGHLTKIYKIEPLIFKTVHSS